MKILITTDCYTPTVNGVVTSVLNLKRALEERGHEVRVLTLSQTRHSFCIGKVTYLGSIDAGRVYPGARLRSARGGQWVRALLQWHPDVVHSQCEFSTFFLARSIAARLQIPLIHTYHTVYEDYTHYFSPSKTWGKRAVRLFTRWVAHDTDCMIAPTEKVRELLAGYGVPQSICVVPSGIDLRRFARAGSTAADLTLRAQLGIAAENKILLFVGRLAAEKNIEELLRALHKVNRPDVTLLLAGDGPQRAALETLTEQLALQQNVVFAGMVAPDKIADYYHMADFFVSASTSETQGLTYIEALAAGLPCLCRKDPCLEGLVCEAKNGWQYQTQQEFEAALQKFLAADNLPQMSRAARNSAAGYSAEAFAARMETIYTERIQARRSAHLSYKEVRYG